MEPPPSAEIAVRRRTDAAKDYERGGDVEAFMKRIGAIMAPKSHIAVVK